MHWLSAGQTHVGKVRKVNEDAILVADGRGLWAVADGMGGHDAGDQASQAVVNALRGLRRASFAGTTIFNLEYALRRCNDALVQMARDRDRELIGSTLVGLTAWNRFAIVSWVGDSRAYLLRAGALSRLTTDHSEVQELVQMGLVPEAEVEHHPRANIITRAVGSDEPLEVDHLMMETRPGDLFLLCSDGLTKELRDREIESCCNAGMEPGTIAAGLIEQCLERDCSDNVSVVVVLRPPGNG